MSKVLIVGGGHAGANTAFALRKDGFDGDITIISDEDYLITDRHFLKIF